MRPVADLPVRTLLLQALAVSFAIIVAGGIASYFQNLDEFSLSLWQLAPALLLIWLVGALMLAVVAAILCLALPSAAWWFLPLVGAVLWVIGGFFVPDYGPMDGTPVDWSRFSSQPWKDLGVVVALGVVLFLARSSLRRSPLLLPLWLLAVQIAYAVASPAGQQAMPHFEPPDPRLFAFSAERNVIVILLDAFQTDAFAEIIALDKGYRNRLAGFTYYPNATSFHPSTYPSIPSIFQGRPYLNEQPLRKYTALAYSDRSILSILARAGFEVDIVRRGGLPASTDPEHIRSVHAAHVGAGQRLREALLITEFTLFKHAPQVARRQLYRNGAWTISRLMRQDLPASLPHRTDLELVGEFERRMNAQSGAPVFKYIHIATPHLPIVFNERLEVAPREFSRETFLGQGRASLQLLLRILDRLQALGVYDNSRIIVIADHGRPGIGVNNDLFVEARMDRKPVLLAPEFRDVRPDGMPLVLVKPERATGPLRIDHAPVALEDIAPTVLDGIATPETPFKGYSLLSSRPPEDRVRLLHYYVWGDHGWKAKYLDPIRVFSVSGHSWLESSWRGPLEDVGKGGKRRRTVLEYQAGEVLQLAVKGRAEHFLRAGWSKPRADGRWTVAKEATVFLPGTFEADRAYVLRLSARPYLRRAVKRQELVVRANGTEVARLSLDDRRLQDLEIRIPPGLAGGQLILQFELPTAVSPKSLGRNEDSREFGIFVASLAVAAEGGSESQTSGSE